VADVRRRLDPTDPHRALPGWVLATAATLGGPVAYLIGARLGAMTLLADGAVLAAWPAAGW
jgi:ethanolamine utilization microcompartment shell protein EutL